MIDLDGNIIFTNTALACMSGYDQKELKNKSLSMIYDKNIIGDLLKLKDKKNGQRNLLFENAKQKRKTGGTLSTRIDGALVTDKSGKGMFIFCIVTDITGLIEKEKSFREKELMLEKAQEIGHVGNWQWDISEDKITWSDELYRIYDIDPTEGPLKYDKLMERIHPEDRDYHDRHTNEWINNRGGKPFEYRILRRDGSIRYIYGPGEVECDENGNPSRMFGIVQDVTERKLAEEKYSRLIETANDAIFVAYADTGIIIEANRAAGELLGIPHDDIIGMHQTELHPREESERYAKIFKDSIEKGNVVLEFYVAHISGKKIPVEVSGSVIDIGGKKMILGIFRDITDRKTLEQITKESEERFRSIVETSQDLIWCCDAEGRFTFLNKAWEKTHGYKVEEMLGRKFTEFQDKDVAERDINEFKRHLAGGSVSGYETTHKSNSGDTINLIFNAVPLFDPDGNIIGTQGTAFDITDWKMAEQDLKNNERLLRESQEFARIGSYVLDINTGIWKSSSVLDEIFGIDEDYVRSVEGWLEIVHPDWKKIMKDYFTQDVVEKRGRFDKEYQIIGINDRKERWVHGLGDLEFDSKGNLISMKGVILDITDRKLSQAALRESEQKFKDVFENAVIGKGIADTNGSFISVNKAFCDSIGYSMEELLSKNWREITHPEDQKKSFEYVEKLMKGDINTFNFVHRLLHKNGSEVWVDLNVILMRDSEGNPQYMIGDIVDVTDRKKAESSLQKAHENFVTIMDGMDSIVYVTDFDSHKILFMNKKAKDSWGDGIGKVCWKVLQADQTGPCVFCTNDKLLDKNGVPTGVYAWEFQNTVNDQWYDCRDLAIRWPDGRYVRMETATNITSRKKTEEVLRSSEEQLKIILNSMGDSIHVVDNDLDVVLNNKAIEEWNKALGFSSDMTGKNIFSIYPFLKENIKDEYKSVFENGKPLTTEESNDLSGRLIITETRKIPVFEGSKVKQVITILRDITTRKTSETELRQSELKYRKLSEKLESMVLERTEELESFTYSASHDLRAPLRHISGFSNLLQENFGETLPEKANHYLLQIQESTKKMDDLIEHLLRLSRIGRKEPKFEEVDLLELIDEVKEELVHEADKRRIDWKIEALPIVVCDKNLMKTTLRNLFSNALKFTGKNEVSKIDVLCLPHNKPGFMIKDNGVGFDMKYHDKIFGVFQRLHRDDEFEGTGIGLAIVKRIVAMHNGRVWAEAGVNKGAVFHVQLPEVNADNRGVAN